MDSGDRNSPKQQTTHWRRCVVCRKLAPKESFWRVVRVYPSQQVQLDHGMGRSAYLCPNRECLTLAQRKDRLGRSLRRAVTPEIYQTLEQRLNSQSVTPDDGQKSP